MQELCQKSFENILNYIMRNSVYTEKDHLYFYKNSTNQTFISNSSKVVYFRKHFACQV